MGHEGKWTISRHQWIVPVAVAGLILLYSANIDSYWDTGGDNACYFILGKALYTGQGYRLINMPSAPLLTKLPPLFPILLSLGMWLMGHAKFPLHWWSLKLIPAIAFLLSTWPFYRLAVPNLKKTFFAMVLLVGWTNPWMLRYANILRPEGIYLLLSLTALALFMGVERGDGVPGNITIGAALAAALATLTRTIGWSLMLSLVAGLALRRKWKETGILLVTYVVVLAPWYLYLHHTTYPVVQESYLQELSGGSLHLSATGWVKRLLGLMWEHIVPYVVAWAGAILYLPVRALSHVPGIPWAVKEGLASLLGLLIILAVTLGIYEAWRRGDRALSLYVAGYMLVTWIWPWQGEKFLVPLLPLAFYLFFSAIVLRYQYDKFRHRWFKWVLGGILVVNVMGLTVWYIHRHIEPYPPEWQRYREVAEWSAEALPNDAVIMARKPCLFYVWSGHWTVPYPAGWENEDVLEALEAQHVEYVVVGAVRPLDEERMKVWIQAHPSLFLHRLSLTGPTTSLYEVVNDSFEP